MPTRTAGDPPAADPRHRALAALCVTEIVSYGVIYYAFPVLASQITADTGWSRTAVTAAYSAGNLAGALASVPARRILQQHGPRLVMTASSVLGAALAVTVPSPARPRDQGAGSGDGDQPRCEPPDPLG